MPCLFKNSFNFCVGIKISSNRPATITAGCLSQLSTISDKKKTSGNKKASNTCPQRKPELTKCHHGSA